MIGKSGSQRAAPRRARGQLESEVLAALWAADAPLTPGEVQRQLGGQLAYNTVHTILTRLYDKGLVARSPAGRAHGYQPTKGIEDLTAKKMAALLDRGSDHVAVLQRFVSTLSAEDESALRQLLARPVE